VSRRRPVTRRCRVASIVRAVPESVASSDDAPPVTAVVLTYRRPRLAGDVVRGLLDKEGFSPHRVVLVVNGQGGLDDAELEATVRTIRLPVNIGPAGGFRAGLEAAFEDGETQWAYLCEDDVGLFNLPSPRVSAVLTRLNRHCGGETSSAGAVVAYGRRFVGRGHSVNVVPRPGSPPFVPVDVAPWGATLVARTVVERGVLPATEWFFGFEDFDFFCRLRASGLSVLLDSESARVAALVQTSAGREIALSTDRPSDAEEPWRAYYVARNHFHLARAHGSPSWQAWHLAYSARRLQLASSNAERRATLHGLVDGLRGRWGPHPRYGRTTGEYDPPA
jgi:rhamnopyranosyl-N-acetylglucosaminyl-diphospho-decaprenol beta-1,3/1,4-galactofuranosyltransferase